MDTCVFCKIVANEIPHRRFYHDELVTAFEDRSPIAPVHILIVPNHHIESLNQAQAGDEQLFGHMLLVARQMAAQMKLDQSGYRLVINTGPDAGQSVFHLHLHIIGGRKLSFSGQ
ncbi:hypothetical protein ADN00_08130 [Ornatilinea apprima]|uniref:HIT domain-containing protein n=1 Tax=Ornatilinea apprima TaxID=1134406 RepID=A0A0N8GNE1_9CHLR|nr:histidine triad nucleotide-binding protein [Ornatilinea apprima]KPL77842.1 hypothetical protein ADN00_08130 [Ornatilinea apprima]